MLSIAVVLTILYSSVINWTELTRFSWGISAFRLYWILFVMFQLLKQLDFPDLVLIRRATHKVTQIRRHHNRHCLSIFTCCSQISIAFFIRSHHELWKSVLIGTTTIDYRTHIVSISLMTRLLFGLRKTSLI